MNKDKHEENENEVEDSEDNLIHVDFSAEDTTETLEYDNFENDDLFIKKRNHVLIRYLEESRKSNEIVTISAFVSIVLATFIFILLSILLLLIVTV